MAPGTHIGAAHPVSGDGQKMDETVAKKAASDTAAYVRSLAEARHRNVTLAEQAVLESRAFTDAEAARASPPLVDVVATDVHDLLRQLDGRTITAIRWPISRAADARAHLRAIEMSRRQRFLGAIAHPQIAYLLLTLGILGLTVELWNPGAVLPGVAGGLSLLLAFFAFQVLPVNAAGLLLILFGIGLLVLELKVPSFGALGVGGAISLFFGSVLTTRGVPGVQVGLGAIVPAVLVLSAGRAAARPPGTGGAAAAAGHRRRRADRSTGAGAVADPPGRAGSRGRPRRNVAGRERDPDRGRRIRSRDRGQRADADGGT